MSSRRKTSLSSVQRSGEDLEVKSVTLDDGIYTESQESEDESEDENEGEEGVETNEIFEEPPPSPPLPMSPLTASEPSSEESEMEEEDVGNGENNAFEKVEEDDEVRSEDGEGEQEEVPSPDYEEIEQDLDTLPSTPFTRNYSCGDCTFHTQNPRTHLYHLRDVHGAKGKIYECKYCVYASNHSQKVNRHLDKCHAPTASQPQSLTEPLRQNPQVKSLGRPEPFQFLKNLLLKEKEEKAAAAMKADRDSDGEHDSNDDDIAIRHELGEDIVQGDAASSEDDDSDEEGSTDNSDDSTEEEADADGDKCDNSEKPNDLEEEVEGEEEDDDVEDEEDEPESSDKIDANAVDGDKNESLPYRCKICNYTTRIRSRFTKHVRYHSMPLIKCTYCDFKTPYKWNLDRHYKSHTGEGSLRCPLCNFSADIKQSITVHIQNHHENLTPVRVLELVQSLDKVPGSSSSMQGQDISQRFRQEQKSLVLEKPFPVRYPQNSTNSPEIVDKNGKVYLKKFECKYCSFKAIWESELNRHLRRTHGLGTAKATTTQITGSASRPTAAVSQNAESDGKMTSTPLCPNVVYSYQDTFEDQGSQSEVVSCEYCQEVFKSDQELILHQGSCVGLAKIQEWNGGLLWNGNDDEMEMNSSFGMPQLESGDAVTTMKKVYKCPHTDCQFWAITASRFHVHMVGHNNSRPFQCSLCSYKSNWRWDIAKHIKVKSTRDSAHLSAKILLKNANEAKNYKEYDQYLMLMKVEHSADLKLPDCSTKADKRLDIKMEIATGDTHDDKDEVLATSSAGANGGAAKQLPIKSSGLSQHNFLKPNQNAPSRRFMKNNFLRDKNTGESSKANCVPEVPNSNLPNNSETEDSTPPVKRFKIDETVPIIWKCKKCSFRHVSKKTVFAHLREFHNMPKTPPVSILKQDLTTLPKSEEMGKVTNTNLNGGTSELPSTGKGSNQYVSNEEGGFTCKLCPFTTMKLDQMVDHSDSHFTKADYTCDFCSYSVPSQKTLDEHVALHTSEHEGTEPHELSARVTKFLKQSLPTTTGSPNKKYGCPECPYVTDSRGQFHYHSQFHITRASLYKCSECSYNVSHKHLLHQHVRVHQLTEVPKSPIPGPSSQESVSSSDSPSRVLICEFCPARFFRTADLRIHLLFHQRQATLQCTECSYSVRMQEHLEAHLQVHSSAYQQRTDEYLTYFEQSNPTTTPVRLRFQDGDEEACEGNPNFQYPTHVKNGKLKEKRYKCKKCPSAFEKRDQYKVHIGLHGSQQRYQCTVCDYAVTFYANFIQHLKKHRGQPGVPPELLASLPPSKRELDEQLQMRESLPKPDPPHPQPALRKNASNFVCEYCDYETKQKHLMDDHKAVMHPTEHGQEGELEDFESSGTNSETEQQEIGVETQMFEEEEGESSGSEDKAEDEENEDLQLGNTAYDDGQGQEQEEGEHYGEPEDGEEEGEEENEEEMNEEEEGEVVED